MRRIGIVLLLAGMALAALWWLGAGVAGDGDDPKPKDVVDLDSREPKRRLPRLDDAQRSRLESGLRGVLSALPARTASSVVVLDPDHGEFLFDADGAEALVPASNQKILVGAALLDRVGEGDAFETLFQTTSPLEAGVVKGDLVITGTGDPSLGEKVIGGDAFAALRVLARHLTDGGLRRIEGRVVADGSRFRGPRTGPAWPRADAWRTWMVEVAPLVFDDNSIEINCRAEAGRAVVTHRPDVGFVGVDNRLAVTDDAKAHSVVFSRPDAANAFTVSGRLYAASSGYSARANVTEGELWFATAFTAALRAEGIEVIGAPAAAFAAPGPLHPLWVYRSPLAPSLEIMLRESNNLYAELFLRRLALIAGEEGSFAGGARALEKWLDEKGIRQPGLVVRDGSGLSRENRVSARQLALVLADALRGPHAETFLHCLAAPGRNGTMRTRLDDLAGRVEAKTGTLSGVTALSGFVKTAQGKRLVFAGLYNGGGIGDIRRVQDRICRLLATL